MDLKGGGIDVCDVETIYPVNTVTAKTAHLITIYLFQTLVQGRAGSCRFCSWKRWGNRTAAVGMAGGGELWQGICMCTFCPPLTWDLPK